MGIERGFALFKNCVPSPPVKGRGIKGEGLVSNLRKDSQISSKEL